MIIIVQEILSFKSAGSRHGSFFFNVLINAEEYEFKLNFQLIITVDLGKMCEKKKTYFFFSHFLYIFLLHNHVLFWPKL